MMEVWEIRKLMTVKNARRLAIVKAIGVLMEFLAIKFCSNTLSTFGRVALKEILLI